MKSVRKILEELLKDLQDVPYTPLGLKERTKKYFSQIRAEIEKLEIPFFPDHTEVCDDKEKRYTDKYLAEFHRTVYFLNVEKAKHHIKEMFK